MNAVTILKRMRTLLKKGWTQRIHARDIDNNIVAASSKSACKFCLYGAYLRVTMKDRDSDEANTVCKLLKRAIKIKRSAIERPAVDCIITFNDTTATTKREVLAVVDKAIKFAQEK